MNAIYSALDAKLTALLAGRSFAPVWDVEYSIDDPRTIPHQLCGKPFFFIGADPVVYAQAFHSAPIHTANGQFGVTPTIPHMIQSYDHSIFQAAIDAATKVSVTEARTSYSSSPSRAAAAEPSRTRPLAPTISDSLRRISTADSEP